MDTIQEQEAWQLFKQMMERRADYRQIAADAVKIILGNENETFLLSPELKAAVNNIRRSIYTITKSNIDLTDRVARLESALEEAGQPLPEREPVNLDDVGFMYPPLRLDALIASVNAGPMWKSAAEPPPPEVRDGPFWVWPLHSNKIIKKAGGRPARYDAETGYWIDPSDGIAFEVTHYVALPQTQPAAP
jgi:hypothetical protein